jgi:hypothetical protein
MLREIKWSEIHDEVSKLCPEIASIVKNIGCDDILYEVSYPYGELIVDKGVFQIPNEEGLVVPITHASIPSKIKSALGYCGTIPLGLVLENSIESYLLAKDRIIPSSILHHGQFISLWRVLEENVSYHTGSFWNISSGARSICMIPHITDQIGYKGIKAKFNLKLNIPETLFDHWAIFSKITKNTQFYQPWQSRILFFPEQWLARKKDKKWQNFFLYLHRIAWEKSSFRRNQFIFDFAFSCMQENRNLRPNPYLADTVRHLIAVGSGAIPGFKVATNDIAAPITGLQKVFLEDYGLKKYAPTIVHSAHFELKHPVYYSFQIPTTIVFSPKSRKKNSAMESLEEVKHIMETLLTEVLRGKLEVENTPLYDLAKNVQYCYYHGDKYRNNEVQMCGDIEKIDPTFTRSLTNNLSYLFPEFSSFFWGCISIHA